MNICMKFPFISSSITLVKLILFGIGFIKLGELAEIDLNYN